MGATPRNPRSASIAEASAHLFLTPKRFIELEAKGVITKADGGGYGLDVIREQYLGHIRQMADGVGAPRAGLDPVHERARRDKEMADRTHLQNVKSRAEHAPMPLLREALTEALDYVRSRLLALPARLAPALVGLDTTSHVQAVLRAAVYTELSEMAAHRLGSPERDAAAKRNQEQA